MSEPADVLYCSAVYPHHPAMERMGTPNAADYETLGRSIKEHEVRVPLIFFVDIDGKEWLLDGRGRVKAMEELGIPVLGTDCVLDTSTVHSAEDGREWAIRCERYYAEQGADPDKIVADLNLARRQLTVQQKRDYVANLLKASPERSNNSTARIAGSATTGSPAYVRLWKQLRKLRSCPTAPAPTAKLARCPRHVARYRGRKCRQ